MKFYTDDVVEVVTGKYKTFRELGSGGGIFELIGQRFIVGHVQKTKYWPSYRRWEDDEVFNMIYPKREAPFQTSGVHELDLRLYHRPIKNWIKLIFGFKNV